ncbi:Tudor domain-containing protein 3 [Babesia sp. Xinjiang]|uniref:Tudor domain-containing protein 3 n=1 Tax=Babesia sp. Xinjiang TaxID=462227 RepID=UPI000A2535C7|nr:Tudor domain-containing protein 3 [Babesia sp. Xinjiang]ORM41340.1 Tudor domain-containing protein 3 [Babesia sp. Xinjiang]
MSIEAGGMQEICREWNLNISEAQATELAALGGAEAPSSTDTAAIKNALLNSDIRVIRGILDNGGIKVECREGVSASKEIVSLDHPLLCQVSKVRDVTKPKDGIPQDENSSKTVYKVTLTTGYISFHAVLLDSCQSITSLAPGTKILIKDRDVLHVDATALLYPGNYEVLGGVVPELYDPWVLQREVALQRLNTGTRGLPDDAPKFEPLATPGSQVEEQMGSMTLQPPPKSTKKPLAKDTATGHVKRVIGKTGKGAKSGTKDRNTKLGAPVPKAARYGPASTASSPRMRPPSKASNTPPKPSDPGVAGGRHHPRAIAKRGPKPSSHFAKAAASRRAKASAEPTSPSDNHM